MTGLAVGNIDTLIDRASTTGPDDLDHYCCCDEEDDAIGSVSPALCGHLTDFTGESVEGVACPLCMLADEQNLCPKYGTCRYERVAS